jgi:hypothetical protein
LVSIINKYKLSKNVYYYNVYNFKNMENLVFCVGNGQRNVTVKHTEK